MVRKMPIPTCQELTASVGDKANHPVVTYIPRAVFGVTLDEALDVAQIANLPAIVFRSIQYLEAKKADQEEGIYRLSGSSAVIKSLKDRFNMGMCSYALIQPIALIKLTLLQRGTSIFLRRTSTGIRTPSQGF